jgi:hypothetical protein
MDNQGVPAPRVNTKRLVGQKAIGEAFPAGQHMNFFFTRRQMVKPTNKHCERPRKTLAKISGKITELAANFLKAVICHFFLGSNLAVGKKSSAKAV